MNANYRNMLLIPTYQEKLVALAVDEAHCGKNIVHCIKFLQTSDYYRGDDFRTIFAKIGELRYLLPSSVHVMAMTATAT